QEVMRSIMLQFNKLLNSSNSLSLLIIFIWIICIFIKITCFIRHTSIPQHSASISLVVKHIFFPIIWITLAKTSLLGFNYWLQRMNNLLHNNILYCRRYCLQIIAKNAAASHFQVSAGIE
ncbi:hypothetical protein ACJX0J_017048, partial [Zea mays]